ncbi:hypothetical protein D5086_014516 [Populus alba]|uniref:Uncharacterized protein n=1 Tax=Populus alba TaxID=43335 RepID=A0ACC4BYI0_POPAL
MGSSLSLIASVAILRSSINDFVPQEIRSCLQELASRFSSELTMVISDSHEGSKNHLFHALMMYLGSNAFSTSSVPQRITVGKNENIKALAYGLDRNCKIVDAFHGVDMKWSYCSEFNPALQYELKWYELRFHKRHASMVRNKYLPYIVEMAKKIKDQNRVVKFYTTRGGRDGWSSMANHLNFDIYSLNLSAVSSDSSLEFLLLHMSNRSILVVEDIDCSIELQNRQAGDHPSDHDKTPRKPQEKVVTLSGLLNAIDGLLSCCGDERVIVFTTNYKDRIDPALLRAGRMDMHINLSYCTFSTFKQLAANYLDIWNHDLFPRIEKLISEVQVSPAEVAGELMKIRNPKTSLEGLSRFLESKNPEKGTEILLLLCNLDHSSLFLASCIVFIREKQQNPQLLLLRYLKVLRMNRVVCNRPWSPSITAMKVQPSYEAYGVVGERINWLEDCKKCNQ